MTRVAVTGAGGFLGWHLRVLAAARGDIDVVPISRAAMENPESLATLIDGCDRVVHLAGVNRGSDEQVREGNAHIAEVLAAAVARCERPPDVAYANSTQCENGSVYGSAKAAASATLRSAAEDAGSGLADVQLPNLFGEHGRPFYNSVVATFSHQLASGVAPRVENDRELDLLHARTAASALLDSAPGNTTTLTGASVTVRGLFDSLSGFAATYRRAEIPPLIDGLAIDLFNTYRSFCSPLAPAPRLPRHVDDRGALVEAVKVHGGSGQCFFSTSRPGVTRGQHYHLRKVERFVVLKGEALISLRKKFDGEVVQHRVTGEDAIAVDMPTMWVHNITNTGNGPLLTLFWTNDLFDPSAPDTYAETV